MTSPVAGAAAGSKAFAIGVTAFTGAIGAGVGLDFGGVVAAGVGLAVGVAPALVVFGMLRQGQREHERRLNEHDTKREAVVSEVTELRVDVAAVKGDVRYLADRERARDRGELRTRATDVP